MPVSYTPSLEGEEFTPTHAQNSEDQDTHRSGRNEEVAHGHVTKIEKSEHMGREIDDHHKITIEHRHLKPGKEDAHDKEKGRAIGFDSMSDSTPESTIHVPEGHGFTVGDHVSLHLKHYDGADNASEHDEE